MRIRPALPMGLGVSAKKAGDVNRAIDDYSHSVKSHPTDVAYVLLARGLNKVAAIAEPTAMQAARMLSKDFEQAQRVAADLVAR